MMAIYLTSINAIDPVDGHLKEWNGPQVVADSLQDAAAHCREHLGYCRIEGMLIATIPCKEGSLEPDWGNMVEHDTTGKDKDLQEIPKRA
jgi:hypothetical protein